VEAIVRLAPDQARLHRVRVTAGVLRERDLVTAEVNRELRDATRRNHTATHLLHAALRRVLGRHVKQAGSLVAPDRLRFDFLHFAALSRDDLDQIERLVNEQICLNVPVETEVRATEEAMAAGAMALFGEKYGDRVRVVSVPGFSVELCGGTHCRGTGDIGFLTIVQEGGIAAGTRRIEALTGASAVRHHQHQRSALAGILQTLNTPADQAVEVIERLEADVKRLGRENSQLKVKLAMGRSALEAAGSTDAPKAGPQPAGETIGGVKVHIEQVDGLDKASLRSLADSHRDRLKSGVVILASADAGKVVIVVSVTKDVTNRVHAGEVVKLIAPIVGGGGGGRPDFAEAGGRIPEKIGELLDESRRVLRRTLEA
jgi:alanyl-tRNA synthetase